MKKDGRLDPVHAAIRRRRMEEESPYAAFLAAVDAMEDCDVLRWKIAPEWKVHTVMGRVHKIGDFIVRKWNDEIWVIKLTPQE